MKSEAIKSATTAATKNALASFNFTAFFFYSNRFALADFDLDKLIEDEELGDDNQTLNEQDGDDALDGQNGGEANDDQVGVETRVILLEDEDDDFASQSEDEVPAKKSTRTE